MSSDTLSLYPDNSTSDGRRNNVVILDGGLGTTLEQTFGLDISHTALWSAKAAVEHPGVVVDAHLAFLRAGATIILTSTYQCSLSTFQKAGYNPPDARRIMSKCVQLTVEARSRFCDEREASTDRLGPDDHGAKIALSLGPFGAGLTPAQEFDGYYPPPFGPQGYTYGGDNYNAFAKDEEGQKKEEDAAAALARYHFERLCIFADDEATWDSLDFIAFETVPLLREIRAIRMAMATLEERRVKRKPWWISFVFPAGKFPETAGQGDARVSVQSVVAAALQKPDPAASSGHLPSPSALGINCTETEMIPGILADMEGAVQAFWAHAQYRPWLILYPNGGDVYDPVSQTWVVQDKGGVWAEKLGAIVAKITQRDSAWAGVVAGGCCRTGPEDIGLLSTKLLGQR
ncbi:Homocysteine S-methyltransferase [Mycena crocata]|nr:Homocysteine S-methyltransferase [Mycena crocata]